MIAGRITLRVGSSNFPITAPILKAMKGRVFFHPFRATCFVIKGTMMGLEQSVSFNAFTRAK